MTASNLSQIQQVVKQDIEVCVWGGVLLGGKVPERMGEDQRGEREGKGRRERKGERRGRGGGALRRHKPISGQAAGELLRLLYQPWQQTS